MQWNENTKFRGVLIDANSKKLHQYLPVRVTTDEVHQDIDCFFHRCKCHKGPRIDGHVCLSYSKVDPKDTPLMEYIDNDRGVRSLSYKVKDERYS